MFLVITNFNEQCVGLVIFSLLYFFLIALLKGSLMFAESNINNKNVGLQNFCQPLFLIYIGILITSSLVKQK